MLVGGVLFRPLAIRYDVFPGHRGYDTPDSQKAPSAKRCIKTCSVACYPEVVESVRKHRAPKGALRRAPRLSAASASMRCQKAPSAKRCIKTTSVETIFDEKFTIGQKAPSAKRCIKTAHRESDLDLVDMLGQKAPSAKRCIKTMSTKKL